MKKLCLILFMLSGLLCFAEDDPDIRVVVTAARDSRNITDVPADMVVIDREMLEGHTLTEALESYAGVTFISFNGNSSQMSVSMRGFGENSYGRVLILVDGVRQNNPDMSSPDWFSLPVSAIERIEVMHGGASVLYGNNAVAGVINIITRKADSRQPFTADAETCWTSFGGYDGKWYMSGAGRNLSFYLAGKLESVDGWRDRTGYDVRQITGRLGFDSEVLTAGLSLSLFSAEYEMAGALTREQYRNDPKQAANKFDESDLQGVNLTFAGDYFPADWADVKLTASYCYKENESDMESWFSWTETDRHSFFVSPSFAMSFYPESMSDQLIIGADLSADILTSKGWGDREKESKNRDNDIFKTSLGFFAHNDMRFFDDSLTVSLGARFDVDKISAEFGSLSPAEDDDITFHPFCFTVGLNYLFPDTSNVYFRYDRVYRTPFTDEQVSYQGYGEGFNADLDPEYGHSFEMGFNFNYLKGLSAGASVYLLLMKDEIAYSNVTYSNENMNDTVHFGVDVKAEYTLCDIFSVSAVYSWTKAEFTSGDYDGNKIPLVPEHRFSLTPCIMLPWGFSLSADMIYVGKFYVGQDYDNDLDDNDAYFITNLYLKYTYNGKFNVTVFGKINNLFDVDHTSCGYAGYDSTTWETIATYYPGTGREFKVGASISY